MPEITITRLGHRGDGIAPGPVYAPRTLPGEVVAGEIEGDRIESPRIITPSPDRVRPPCPHYKSCGGCQVQHASDGFVASWKVEIVTAALSAQGLELPILGIATSPPGSRRRASLAGRRLKSGPVVGFHAARSDTVVAVPDCKVLSPDLLACLPALEAMTAMAGSRKGEISFALTATETGVDCAATGGRDLDAALARELPGAARGLTRLTWNGEPVFAETAPQVTFGRAAVQPPPGAFLQATEEGEAALAATVMDALSSATRIADLFAGCGTFALRLAEHATVHAVEGDPALVAALDAGARRTPGLKPVTTAQRDLFRRPLSPQDLEQFDGVVIDPPRAGAAAQTAAIAEAQVPRVAMVSCNPATFARDARLLVEAGYVSDGLRIVDQFRWSTHVELAAAFRQPHIAGEPGNGAATGA
ncbi:class I SAM-dependent RNA methyltransferase [Rhodobacterales bacterium HKCCE3408]|nr:class I SAM-dependent RNA methyltransferase [Rhodobacterales bacterium HKCCE3408]